MARRNYDKLNLDPHKEAKFAMWFWSSEYAKSRMGSMQFYKKYLTDSDRKMCEEAVQKILNARDRRPNEM